MSARRRQEVLERFSIPLEVKNTPPITKRSRRSVAKVIIDSDDYDPEDRDFVSEEQSDDDGSLPDYSDNDSVCRTKKGKGKGKAKMKSKPKRATYFHAFSDCEIPVVMLISLKAGALGLNLTVANNVSDSPLNEGLN